MSRSPRPPAGRTVSGAARPTPPKRKIVIRRSTASGGKSSVRPRQATTKTPSEVTEELRRSGALYYTRARAAFMRVGPSLVEFDYWITLDAGTQGDRFWIFERGKGDKLGRKVLDVASFQEAVDWLHEHDAMAKIRGMR